MAIVVWLEITEIELGCLRPCMSISLKWLPAPASLMKCFGIRLGRLMLVGMGFPGQQVKKRIENG